MTRLYNEPDAFAAESAAGFTLAFSPWVRAVSGGVVRRAGSEPGVAVVIGGGSGHYPAFAGLVGTGMAHGAVMGNLFASPSAHQVYEVARAAESGHGVLLSYGNYAGDVLNFNEAQERLRAEGIPCETVVVTDDVSSAPTRERHRRRGIAGGLVVFKVAGAASAAGYKVDDVVRVARHANERTRTLGVAFSGCTLPGAPEPLFTVAAGRMAVGMGIHGEPGIDETDIPTARGLAALLVEKLLTEPPEEVDSTGARVVAILNGLGSVKYEELFVLYNNVAKQLNSAELHVVASEVGEFVTSFDMAGVSLTLCWLDDELEELWFAPADTPAYRRSAAVRTSFSEPEPAVHSTYSRRRIRLAALDSRTAASIVHGLFAATASAIDDHAAELGRLDAVAGDGDHGIGMQRGAHAASDATARAVADGAGVATAMLIGADAWEDRGGGTSGALWGAGLRAFAGALSDDAAPQHADLIAGLTRAAEEIMRRGGAVPGDKTMVDVLIPFRDAFVGSDTFTALSAAVPVAESSALGTAALLPRIGRARPHAERSLGSVDPGAQSLAIVLRTVLDVCEAGVPEKDS